jgi:hypothetical protein
MHGEAVKFVSREIYIGIFRRLRNAVRMKRTEK